MPLNNERGAKQLLMYAMKYCSIVTIQLQITCVIPIIITNNYNKVLPAMGMKREEHIGNLIINFTVTFPEKLTSEQIEALRGILQFVINIFTYVCQLIPSY